MYFTLTNICCFLSIIFLDLILIFNFILKGEDRHSAASRHTDDVVQESEENESLDDRRTPGEGLGTPSSTGYSTPTREESMHQHNFSEFMTPRRDDISPLQTSPFSSASSRKKIPWSKEEVELLNAGLQKHGHGSWELIRKEFFEPKGYTRTGNQLKDKYRTSYGDRNTKRKFFLT